MLFLYAFVAVLCLGLAPLVGKAALYNINPVSALMLRTLIAAVLVAVWMVGTKTYTEFMDLSLTSWCMIGTEALLAAVLGDLAYFYALKRGDVYEISVVMSCAPLVTIILGSLLFSQPLAFKQLIGAVVVTVGLLILYGD